MAKIKEIPMEKLIARQMKLWELTYQPPRHHSQAAIKPCITISKEAGSGGVELAKGLSERLQWRFFDKDLVEYIAKNAKVRKEMVETFDEKTQNEIHNWVLTLLNRHALGSDKYFKHLVTVIRSISEHGYVIIVGRGGNFVVSKESALRLKIHASLKDRISQLSRVQQISLSEAEKVIFNADRERWTFVRRFFHKDYEDPFFYDLILNMSSLSLEAAEKIVLSALEAKFPGVFKRRPAKAVEL